MIEFNTARIAPRERLDYWDQEVFRRMSIKHAATPRNFSARLSRADGSRGAFWDHTSHAMHVERDARRCANDGGDEIYVGLLLDGPSRLNQNGVDSSLPTGSLYVVDFARPVRAAWSSHREIALIIPRARVSALAGRRAIALGGRRLERQGLGELLASHLMLLSQLAPGLAPADRAVAIDGAIDLACAALHRAADQDADLPPAALLPAARLLIEQRYADAQLSPARIAAALGCSRSELYRAFDGQEESIAATLWRTRLEQARRLLTLRPGPDLNITQVATHCGFLDPSHFSRMFRRRFGMSPSDMRELTLARNPDPAMPASRRKDRSCP